MYKALLALILLFLAVVIDGSWMPSGVLIRERGEFGRSPETRTLAFDTRVLEAGRKVGVLIGGRAGAGTIAIKATGPEGTTLFEERLGSPSSSRILEPLTKAGPLHVEVVAENAIGFWDLRMVTMGGSAPIWFLHFGGPLQIMVAFGCVIWWQRRAGAAYRWFLAGAAVWTVAVGLKFLWADCFNPSIIPWIAGQLREYPSWIWMLAAGAYVGSLTGIFEGGGTLVAGLLWKRLAADSTRAVAVGIGAGSFEALLIGIGRTVAMTRIFLGPALSDGSLIDMHYQELILAPLFFEPLGRLLCTLCHTSTRVLVLYALATRRWRYALYGMLILTAVDTIVGYFIFANYTDTIAPWLAMPFFWAIISVPAIYWCIRSWPRKDDDALKSAAGEHTAV